MQTENDQIEIECEQSIYEESKCESSTVGS